MTTEMLMVGAIRRGLTLRDFEYLTIGMIIDYCSEYDESVNPSEDSEKMATQEDYDKF
ncbi:MAG: hypothetical protein AB7E42_03225 [Anaerotignaceae bacterium]